MERYGGTIASSLGDEVMAVFGVPRVHEDDAFRAVSAALEIRDAPARDASGSGSATGVGIATGEVLASGSGAGMLSVIGDPVTAAGELEDAAAAGEILLGEETERLVRGAATVEPVDTEAGPAWRLRDLAHERPAVGSLKAPLVGRGPELAQLRQAFERVDPRAHAAPVHDPRDGGDRKVEARAGARRARRRDGRPSSSAAASRTARASPSGRCAR